jgi:hypothetical protein
MIVTINNKTRAVQLVFSSLSSFEIIMLTGGYEARLQNTFSSVIVFGISNVLICVIS